MLLKHFVYSKGGIKKYELGEYFFLLQMIVCIRFLRFVRGDCDALWCSGFESVGFDQLGVESVKTSSFIQRGELRDTSSGSIFSSSK